MHKTKVLFLISGRTLFELLDMRLSVQILFMRALSSENLDSFRKDVAGLGQEQGGHGLLVGKRGVEVVEHLV